MDKAYLMTIKEVASFLGMSVTTINRMTNKNHLIFDPLFPPKIKVGHKFIRFNSAEVQKWLDKQLARGTAKTA